ncbi:thiol-disulfide oxidoreductase DCC family protein [Parasediminibacterium sp. JCM 36343]|uniref:thiol-disulfide oxidoreductase DCC family protein n=1 Tax=Parasediminibacterium sp. JCM 36343 TaxID=3374279 RepID=UPI00397DC600
MVTNAERIILFDGVCNLCSSSVQFVIRHDAKGIFKFASLQSNSGQVLLAQYHLPQTSFNSFVYLDNGRVYLQSSAALQVARHLDGAWFLLYYFIIVPPFIRNWVYRTISNNRYKWFGKQDACWLPTPALQKRFLD